ncbi:outer membrane protein assembly factor BamB family protein [Membranihabitans marinus]|uniref:outer membrane protein assembly factor BamB family protein n=1 Tax=Membranihabitans marinus TaxID=1227546 RepID=UPI001F31E288|nr:PQQ-binding-like beta-propeller repeat protein [Membranihabitans marinus]
MGCMQCQNQQYSNVDWSEYNGSGHRNHYSNLDLIHRENVEDLTLAWVYDGGGQDSLRHRSQIQCNPIIINGILYGMTADNQVFALRAGSGEELWKTEIEFEKIGNSRGLTMYGVYPEQRLFFGGGRYLYALNPQTGQLFDDFGKGGRIDLSEGIARPGSDNNVSMSTPATLYEDLLIVGCRLSESIHAMLGDVRAYDVWTGELKWTFETIPSPDQPGSETWAADNPREVAGGANCWMGSAIDRDLGIVYVPTGSAAYDFYGGNRAGDNLYANCLLALDARTGEKIWHYQLVRHDIWDRDPPAPPNLFTINYQGREYDVVSIVTKQGHVFVFDRRSGQPIFPIVDSSFVTEAMPGEYVSPRQPIPLLPEPFTRQSFDTADVNHFMTNRDSIIDIIMQSNTGSPYIPITEKRTIFFPGTDGGAQWGGAAVDEDGIMYVPAKEIPVYTSLVPKWSENEEVKDGAALYRLHCSACHGENMEGNHDGSYPSLQRLEEKLDKPSIRQILDQGKARMPAFSFLSGGEKDALVEFLHGNITQVEAVTETAAELPYQHTGYNRWYEDGFPISKPPWGSLTAIDINSGKRKWQVPLGTYPELMAGGLGETGTDNYGGPLVTQGNLVFIAASRDEKIRAFDKFTGEKLWEHDLPAAGYASPATYSVNGKQYVVIACGGGKLNTKSGGKYAAFTIPLQKNN